VGLRSHAGPAADGKPRNTAYYTILAGEWPEVERSLQAKLQQR